MLFDQLITFQLEPLKAATKALHEVDAALAKKDNAQARALAKEARDLIAAMPITDAQAASPEMRAAFTGGKEKTRAPGRARAAMGGLRQGEVRRRARPRLTRR